jgi:hypothetical protein
MKKRPIQNKILHAVRTKLYRQKVEIDRKKESKKRGLFLK